MRNAALTVGLLGITVIAVYFIQKSLKDSATAAIQAAAPSGGYNAGKGAVDAVFANVMTLLSKNQITETPSATVAPVAA
jgi:hypothetical protein